jgi:hypothetical protein
MKPSITLTAGSKGKWTAIEDSQLKDAVQTHGDKDWSAISALVPGRTKVQCLSRWHTNLNPSIARTPPGRLGKWTEDEDSELKDAVQSTVGRIGPQSPLWFLIEREISVIADGIIP